MEVKMSSKYKFKNITTKITLLSLLFSFHNFNLFSQEDSKAIGENLCDYFQSGLALNSNVDAEIIVDCIGSTQNGIIHLKYKNERKTGTSIFRYTKIGIIPQLSILYKRRGKQ